MAKLRVIIGQGTASEVYQFTGTSGEYETIVIGPRGLWATLPSGHAMGQPPHLLAMPGRKVPAFQAPTGKTQSGLKQFLDVKTYQENLMKLAGTQTGQRKEFTSLKVSSVERSDEDGKIFVKVRDPANPTFMGFKADQVIIATGIGPQKQPQDVGIKVSGNPDGNLGFKQMEEGIDYLTHADKLGRVVVVYGGGATGAWVAAEVNAHMAQKQDAIDWCWMAQPGGTGFSKSVLPGDRNAQIVDQEKFQVRYAIKSAVYRAKDELRATTADIPGLPTRPMVELTVQRENADPFPYLVDQLIYCIGGNPTASGSISAMLDDGLVCELEPLKDMNRMVSDGTGVLAWATPKRDLIIIGAATFNFQEPFFNKKAQSAPMGFLPPNAQVPDGIAVAISTIEALNTYMPVTPSGPSGGQQTFKQAAGQKVTWNINFNTSNRSQIAAFLASNTDADAFTANLQVALIVYLRSKNNFGLNEEQVKYVMGVAERTAQRLRTSVPKFDTWRLNSDKKNGPDGTLQYFLTTMTTKDEWKTVWTGRGMKC